MAVLVFNTIVNVIAEMAWGLPRGIWDIRDAYPWLWLVGLAFCHLLLVLRQSFERTGRARRGA